MLKFSYGNSKLKALQSYLGLKKGQVIGFDLPAGYTCPMADICLSISHKVTGKIIDGKNMKFRCYAASTENRFPNSRRAHWHNYNILKGLSVENMVREIQTSLPKDVKVIRIHASGDYFNQTYFIAWRKIAENNPHITFFGYSKVLQYVQLPKPENYKLVYSYGGKMDIFLQDEPCCKIVNSVSEGLKLGLPVACQEVESDDFDYIMRGQSFCIVIHGTQPAKKK